MTGVVQTLNHHGSRPDLAPDHRSPPRRRSAVNGPPVAAGDLGTLEPARTADPQAAKCPGHAVANPDTPLPITRARPPV